ncbi:MAG TPA: methyl-accepting chemotaxis protein [Rhodocyclaceae bacterium]
MHSIEQALTKIESMASAVNESSNQVSALEQRSAEVGNIASVIREIADQTNLLALNAAIEAARAGEQGRGFAVVADEVRKLAERTTQATSDIAAVIDQIHRETGSSVASMRDAAPLIQQGMEMVRVVAEMLGNIRNEASDSLHRARNVSTASSAQAVSVNQAAQNVERVSAMTGETTSVMQGNAGRAAELQEMAHQLRDKLHYFKVS